MPYHLILSLALLPAVQPVKEQVPNSTNDLSIAFAIPKAKSGSSVLQRHGSFHVVFTNRSAKPIRLWSEHCQLGHDTLFFRAEEGGGEPTIMRKRGARSSAWEDEPSRTFAILPGNTFSWKV